MLIFIGTLHCGLTPEDELIRIIESFTPSLLLVEIFQKDVEDNNIEKYPPEMRAVLTWGINNCVDVRGFDSRIKTLKEGASEEDVQSLDKEQSAITSRYNWKDFNKVQFDRVLETKSWKKIVDKSKDGERNIEMYNNIVRLTGNFDPDATAIITTGSGHIPFFRTMFPAAQFPLG